MYRIINSKLKKQNMNKLLIIFLLFPLASFGQRNIQHEPQRVFHKLLKINLGEFNKNHDLKKVVFRRDTIFSSSYELDENGNILRSIGSENEFIKEAIYKYDSLNRTIESKHYKPDNTFSYGYYYKYVNGTQLKYKLIDSILLSKSTFLKGENISIYSKYNEKGENTSKNISVYDDNRNILHELRFHGRKLHMEYRYEYLGNEKYVTSIYFDKKGVKVKEERILDKINIPEKNISKHHTKEGDYFFRTDSFDTKGNLIKMVLIDKSGNPYKIESSYYNSAGQLIKDVEKDYEKDRNVIYNYEYDESGKVITVVKESGKIEEIFRYEYEYF